MKVFPYLLARIGGGSFDNLAPFNSEALITQVAHLAAQNKAKARISAQLCENLLLAIKALPDSKIQNQVLNLRRDIFNQRPVKPQLRVVAEAYLPPAVTAELACYLALTTTIRTEEEKLAGLYAALVSRSRRHLQQLAQDPALQKGLVLSSQSLLQALTDYCRQEPGGFRKKELQTEQSLLKYLTRMYTKTSPFSTFNNLALGTLTDLSGQAWRVSATAAAPVVSHIRLNNNLFKYLKDLFWASQEIYSHLWVRANPTIAPATDHYVYLTNYNNIEAFQRVPQAAVLKLALQLVQAKVGGIRFGALAAEIGAYVEAPASTTQDYLRQLISYGFLEFDLGVSGTDPDWDLKLCQELQYVEAQGVCHVAELRATLAHIRTLAAQYAQAPVAERQIVLNQVYHQFRNICLKLHAAAGLPAQERKTPAELQAEWLAEQKEAQKKKEKNARTDGAVLVAEAEAPAAPPEVAFQHRSATYFNFKPEQFFYEDTTRELALQIDATQLTQLVNNLDGLLQEMRPFRGMADEQALMAAYYKQKYRPDAPVNLLRFYEDFYRDIKKPEAEWLARQQRQTLVAAPEKPAAPSDPETKLTEPALPATEKLAPANEPPFRKLLTSNQPEKIKTWVENLAATLRGVLAEQPEQVNLSLDLIRAISGAAAPAKPVAPNAYGAFVQLYQQKNEAGQWQLQGVLNATMGGYGKMMSRFLHIFPGEVTQTIKAWNQALMPAHSLFIEDVDASYFNANLHPPLMPYEIRMPGGHNSLPPDSQLPIADFEVRLDALAGEVQLYHRPSGKRSYVFDLGFQGQGGRSQLFQLLDKFTRAEYLFSYPVVSGVNEAMNPAGPDPAPAAPEPRVVVRPRIMFQNQLVLQRKGWYVPKQLIPVRQPDTPDWQYYLTLNEWRLAQGIADEVYVTLTSDRQHTGLEPEQIKKLGRDDYKPQYINFNYPLLVHLFEKLLAKVPYTLKIEEMLPNSGHLLKINNQRFVTEFVLQWYGE